MRVKWCSEKSRVLKYQRGLSFEEILKQRFIGIVEHPSRPDQRKMLFEYQNYVWAVPYVIQGDEMFLKTMYPCRKYTKLYRGEIGDEEN